MATDVMVRMLVAIDKQQQTFNKIAEIFERHEQLSEELRAVDVTLQELSAELVDNVAPLNGKQPHDNEERPVGRRQRSTNFGRGYKAAATRRKLQTTPTGRDFVLFALLEGVGTAGTVEELFNSSLRLGYRPQGKKPLHTFRMAVRAQRIKGFIRQVPGFSPKTYQLTANGRKEAQRLQKQFGWSTERSARVPIA